MLEELTPIVNPWAIAGPILIVLFLAAPVVVLCFKKRATIKKVIVRSKKRLKVHSSRKQTGSVSKRQKLGRTDKEEKNCGTTFGKSQKSQTMSGNATGIVNERKSRRGLGKTCFSSASPNGRKPKSATAAGVNKMRGASPGLGQSSSRVTKKIKARSHSTAASGAKTKSVNTATGKNQTASGPRMAVKTSKAVTGTQRTETSTPEILRPDGKCMSRSKRSRGNTGKIPNWQKSGPAASKATSTAARVKSPSRGGIGTG